MHIALLLDHPQAFRTLRPAFRLGPGGPVRAQLRFPSTWTELHDILVSNECHLAIVQPCHGQPPTSTDPGLAELETLATIWPREQVILFVVSTRPHPSLLRDIGQMAFPFLLVQGIDDDSRTILRTVARRPASPPLDLDQPGPGRSTEPENRIPLSGIADVAFRNGRYFFPNQTSLDSESDAFSLGVSKDYFT